MCTDWGIYKCDFVRSIYIYIYKNLQGVNIFTSETEWKTGTTTQYIQEIICVRNIQW